ncbi:MAG: radical SAM protein [Thermoguttaceae bacterium]
MVMNLNLNALPQSNRPFNKMDIDLTLECNMNCRYCFKEKRHGSMQEQTAYDAIVWFLYASGHYKNISISLMGGEPLLRWPLIMGLVPFAVRRAKEHEKVLGISMTTNCTLITDEIIEFAREWNVQFLSSFDGIEKVQNYSRPLKDGRNSFTIVEQSVKKMLAFNPQLGARATVLSKDAATIFESYQYFRELVPCKH